MNIIVCETYDIQKCDKIFDNNHTGKEADGNRSVMEWGMAQAGESYW